MAPVICEKSNFPPFTFGLKELMKRKFVDLSNKFMCLHAKLTEQIF